MASNVYRLSVRRGPEEGQTFPLTSSSVTVGRDPMADIVISDPEVSRQHARFTRTEEGYQVQDLGSTNGTFVDGKRLGGEFVPLRAGAVITMGSNVTLVLEGEPDPMATVISPAADFDLEEEEQAGEDAMGTMIETPEEADELPSFEAPVADFGDDVMTSDSEATSLEYPSTPDLEPSLLDEDESEELFSFDFDEADYGEPVPPSTGAAPDDRTVLDMEASDFSSFSGEYDDEDDALPSFGDSPELPSFGEEPAVQRAQQPPAESPGRIPPPPPPPPSKSEADPNRRRNMIIAVVVLLLLCCCCSILVTYFYLGDVILEYMQF